MKTRNLIISFNLIATLVITSCSETKISPGLPLSSSSTQEIRTPFIIQSLPTKEIVLSQGTLSPTSLPPTNISENSLSLPDRVANANITWHYSFDILQDFNINKTGFRNTEGYAVVENATFWRKFNEFHSTTLEKGQGVILRVKFDPKSETRVFFETTTPDDKYLRWGVFAGYYLRTDSRQDDFDLSGGTWSGEMKIIPDHWYYLLLGIEKDEDFLAIIWDSEDPDKQLIFEYNSSADWHNHIWDLNIRGRFGRMYIDQYYEISFNNK